MIAVVAGVLIPATAVAIVLAVLVGSPVLVGAASGLGGLGVAMLTVMLVTTGGRRRRRPRAG